MAACSVLRHVARPRARAPAALHTTWVHSSRGSRLELLSSSNSHCVSDFLLLSMLHSVNSNDQFEFLASKWF